MGHLFCPTCANLLLVEQAGGDLRFCCQSCCYVYSVDRKMTKKVHLETKEVDDVLGGEDAWKNVDKTEASCSACGAGQAYFMQIQIRSADEPASIFYKCCNVECGARWREGILLYIAGISFPFFYPYFIRNTYISENALMPGVAKATFSAADASAALAAAGRIEAALRSGNGTSRVVGAEASALELGSALDVYTHVHQPPRSVMSPGHSETPSSCTNTMSVLRAPHGDGKESLVLVFPIQGSPEGVGLALLHVLGRARWLAKDVVLLVPDADPHCLPIHGVESWLDVYHSGDDRNHPGFRRAGQIQAGIVLDMSREPFNELQVLPEAYNGQLPNLDLMNTAVLIARRHERVKTALESEGSLWSTDGMGHEAMLYLHQVGSALRFMSRSVSGAPSGAHAPFMSHMVSAVTLRTAEGAGRAERQMQQDQLGGVTKVGRVLEGTVRCCSNLLERWHQSFFQYVLISTNHFLSIDVYMVPLGLLLACLPLHAAALNVFGPTGRPPRPKPGVPGGAGGAGAKKDGQVVGGRISAAAYLRAMATVCVAHAWGAGVAAAPLALAWAGLRDRQLWLLAWAGWAVISWRLATAACAGLGGGVESKKQRNGGEGGAPDRAAAAAAAGEGGVGAGGEEEGWLELQVATSCTAGVLLAGFAAANWALSYSAAVLLVPLCLLARPLGLGKAAGGRQKGAAGAAASLALGSLASPPACVAGAAWLAGEGVAAAAWSAVEGFSVDRTATYPFACCVYLPVCALCWRIALWRTR